MALEQTFTSYTTAQDKIDALNEDNDATDVPLGAQYFNKFFYSTDGLNQHRPYGTAPVANLPNTATIVLISKGTDVQAAESDVFDYFVDFETTVTTAGFPSSGGNVVPVLNDINENYYGIFKNFSLMSTQESHDEIVKVSLNFGPRWNAFFFGEQPKVYVFTGFFLDAQNYPYYEEFMRAYKDYLAGGKCIERGYQMYMAYDGKIVKGWMLGIEITDDSTDEYIKKFSFKLLIEDENFYRQSYVFDEDGNFRGRAIGELSNSYRIPGLNKNWEKDLIQ